MPKTLFVNPTKSRKHAKRRRRAVKSNYRAKRRNAGIVPFVQSANPRPRRRRNASLRVNPMLVANPRRKMHRRPRHSNPLSSPKKAFVNALLNIGGSGVGAAANYFGIAKIENVWARNGSRIVLSSLSGFVPGAMGGSMAGALLMPAWVELFNYFVKPKAAPTEADLDSLAADLEDLMAS